MINKSHAFEQEVITDNKEIFFRIVKELEAAEFEILIAAAWFTDRELFELLKRKANQNVQIQLITSVNQGNEKLDFDELINLGVSVTKIKRPGYGIMNQKFCVIDKRVAMHGSYNWSVSARTNNQESIIVTNHTETVQSLLESFNNIRHKLEHQDDDFGNTKNEIKKSEIDIEHHSAKKHAVDEFTRVLNSMIAAEIGNFDRALLRQQGYDRSRLNNGNHEVLTKSFDTVYSVFINDIDVVDDKKRRLIAKIGEQEINGISSFEESLNLQLQTAEIECENELLNAKNKIINDKSEIEKNVQQIENLKENKLHFQERAILQVKEKIRTAQRDFVRPKFKWYEFIPVAFANLCLIAYVFIFYSSACYILLFAVEDAKVAKEQGLLQIPMEIFNPRAFGLTLKKGGSGFMFILLFVSVPLFSALIKLFTKKSWIIILMFVFGILFVDSGIAYKVSQAIYEGKYLSGKVNEVWQAKMAFGDINFYLVFLLGAFGLLMLKFAFEKLISIFDERNPDIASLKNDMLLKQMDEDLKAEEIKCVLIKQEILEVENSNIDLLKACKMAEGQFEAIPNRLNKLKEIKSTDLITGKQQIKTIANIYISHVENDNLPISIDSLNDRINIFLEGWTGYLNEEYAIPKAIEKSREAFQTAIEWQRDKIVVSQIDKRIRFY